MKGIFDLLRKVILYSIIAIVVLIVVMVVTTPSKEAFNMWVSSKYNIECKEDGNCFKKGNLIRFDSSHFRNVGLFASYEQQFENADGEEITIKTLGVFGCFLEIDNSKLWGILN